MNVALERCGRSAHPWFGRPRVRNAIDDPTCPVLAVNYEGVKIYADIRTVGPSGTGDSAFAASADLTYILEDKRLCRFVMSVTSIERALFTKRLTTIQHEFATELHARDALRMVRIAGWGG